MTVPGGASLVDVRAGYGSLRRRRVLDGVSLEAAPGQVTALVGPNGVGKTTLFRVLLGFLRPWSGTVQVCGSDPAALRRRQGIGYLPESVSLPPGYTPRALLEEGARLSGLRGEEADAAVASALAECGLEDVAGRPLRTFSKGMGRMAALAFARIGAPPLLLLDEPMSGLDPRARAELRAAIEASARACTVVLASHDLAEVGRAADVVYVLGRGRVTRRLHAEQLAGVDLESVILRAERLQ